MAAFSDILGRTSAAAERPKPLPQGGYICIVKGLPLQGKSAKKLTPFVEFALQPMAAQDDVDQAALQAMGGFDKKTIKATFYLTDDSEYRLKEFLDDCGIPREQDGEDLSHAQRIDMSPNCQVVAYIKHTPSDDGESVYANIGGTAPVE